jgi:hypothetical protein
LINDSCKELDVHCNNLNLVNDKTLSRYNLNNFLLIVFPNKSLIYKNYLPEQYKVKYRPAIEEYKKILDNKLVDGYKVLKNELNTYYKTDTHINIKGSYIVYKYFIEKVNKIYNLNIKAKDINILDKECVLNDLNYGIGDLLWENNLGEQTISDNNKIDVFYYSNDINYLYYQHKISNNNEIRVLNKDLTDINHELDGSLLTWEILSNNILYKKNITGNNLKVIFFYDSFLISLLDLYLSTFYEVYMIKEVYDKKFIDIINPDYVFEFRVERFLF